MVGPWRDCAWCPQELAKLCSSLSRLRVKEESLWSSVMAEVAQRSEKEQSLGTEGTGPVLPKTLIVIQTLVCELVEDKTCY